MSRIASSTTLNIRAYLTDEGRQYFSGINSNGHSPRVDPDGTDNFRVVSFSLYDTDTNYKSSVQLSSGDVPDVTGNSEKPCLKTSSLFKLNNKRIIK